VTASYFALCAARDLEHESANLYFEVCIRT